MAFMGSIICIYNKEGKVLLQKRTADAPTYPSHWALFAGTVEEGERAMDTLKREMLEELEYELQKPRFHFIIEHNGPKHFFSEEFKDGSKLVLHEGDKMRWFSLNELDELKIVPYHKEAIKRIISDFT